jgi:hypothetical protein
LRRAAKLDAISMSPSALGLRDPQIDHDIKGCTRGRRPPPGQQGNGGT